MVKTPKTRHSRPRREPVTIELEPGEVSRIEKAAEQPDQAEIATPNREAAAEQAAHASQAVDDAGASGMVEAKAANLQEDMPAEPAVEPAENSHPQDGGAESVSAQSDPAFGETPLREDGEGMFDAAGQPSSAQDRDSAPRPSAGEKRSGLGTVAAGIIGGVIALAGAGALQYAGLLGLQGETAIEDASSQIADLQAQITALRNAGDGGLGMRLDNLSTALEQVKADVAALQEADASGSREAAFSALADKVAGIEKTLAEFGQAGNAASVDLTPVNEKLAALEALARSAGDAASAQESRLAALEQSVSQLSAKVDAQASQPKIALAIAASALKSAVDRGGPFVAELDTFAAIAPDAPQIASLRPYAEQGVPTRGEIADQMSATANAMIAAAEPADPDAGFLQRLLTSAESLVKVRPIGAVEGAGVPETVARMEVAVNQGDYGSALGEYETLPEPAKAAGADFAGKLKARLEAEAQIDALISSAMKS